MATRRKKKRVKAKRKKEPEYYFVLKPEEGKLEETTEKGGFLRKLESEVKEVEHELEEAVHHRDFKILAFAYLIFLSVCFSIFSA